MFSQDQIKQQACSSLPTGAGIPKDTKGNVKNIFRFRHALAAIRAFGVWFISNLKGLKQEQLWG